MFAAAGEQRSRELTLHSDREECSKCSVLCMLTDRVSAGVGGEVTTGLNLAGAEQYHKMKDDYG